VRHDFLDRYSRVDSPIHRLPAETKLLIALAFLLTILLMPLPMGSCFTAMAVFLLAIAVVSRIPPGYLIKRLLWFEPMVLGVAMLAWFQPNGGRVFASILVKSTLCLLTMILLSNTTPFSSMLRVLRGVRVPPLFITTLALMYRYLFVLVDEAERMQRARASRTFLRRRRDVWKTLGTVIGQLFVRSTERAERIYAAMCARGWK
jgi:cobalt/nickel transport system permease protein